MNTIVKGVTGGAQYQKRGLHNNHKKHTTETNKATVKANVESAWEWGMSECG